MNLDELQRAVFEVIRQPLTDTDGMRASMPDGRPTREIVERIVKPNNRLTSFERLEIYNRQYWFRLLSSIGEDYEGLRAILGDPQFEKLAIAYLNDHPSESYTLRNLPSRLEDWLRGHREFAPGLEKIAIDMVRLEWAEIVAYDSAELPAMDENALRNLEEDPVFRLQPYISLLDLSYPVDDLLVQIRGGDTDSDDHVVDIASNAVTQKTSHSKIPRSSLPRPKKVFLAVHRQEGAVYFKRLERDAFGLLLGMSQGKRLSEAIVGSVNWSNRKIENISVKVHDWFVNWATLKWFCSTEAES